MTNGITLLGDMALIKALKELDKKAQNQIARKACREGAKEIAREVKSTISVRSGQTRRAVKVRVAKRKKGRVRLDVRIGAGDFKGETYYAAFVEYGWKTGKRGTQGRKQVPGQHKIRLAFENKQRVAQARMRAIMAAEIEQAADRY